MINRESQQCSDRRKRKAEAAKISKEVGRLIDELMEPGLSPQEFETLRRRISSLEIKIAQLEQEYDPSKYDVSYSII